MKTIADMPQLTDTYAEYLDRESGHQATTIARYLASIRRLQAFVGDDSLPLERLPRETIAAFAGRLVNGRKPSASTFNTRLAALRSFYRFAYEFEYVHADPTVHVKPQRQKGSERMPLTMDEAHRVLDVIKLHARDAQKARDIAIFVLFIHSALRVSEVVNLNVDQIDFDNRAMTGVRTKGGKSMVVYFSDLVSEALERALKCRVLLNPNEGEEAVFLSNRGSRLSVRTAQQLVTKYGKLAGIKNPVTPHVLRHSSVTAHVEIGTPLPVIQRICNHASVKTTERYVHLGDGKRREAADALSSAWKRRNKDSAALSE